MEFDDEAPEPSQEGPARFVIRSPRLSPGTTDSDTESMIVYEEVQAPPAGGVSRLTAAMVIVAALVVIVAAIAAVPHFVSKGTAAPQTPQLATASLRTFPEIAQASGTVVPSSEVAVNFPSSGPIQQIDVHVGQTVAAGQTLAVQADPTAQDAVARDEADLTDAETQLTDAENPLGPARAAVLNAAVTAAQTSYNSTVASVEATAKTDAAIVAADNQAITTEEHLLAQNGCSATAPSNAIVCQDEQTTLTTDQGRLQDDQGRAEEDAADGAQRESNAQSAITQATDAVQAAEAPVPTQVAAAQSAVNAAKAALQSDQAQLAAANLTAPTAGTVLQINGQVGELTPASSTSLGTLPGTDAPIPQQVTDSANPASSTASPGLVIIGTTTSWVVGAAFPSADDRILAADQTGTLTATTLGGLSMPCHVLAVSDTATTVNGAPSIYVSIIPEGPASELASGDVVDVNIDIGQATRVLAVPQSAVYTVSGVPHVNVWTGTRSVATAVGTGIEGTELIQITSGLSAGQQVVLAAYDGLPTAATTP